MWLQYAELGMARSTGGRVMRDAKILYVLLTIIRVILLGEMISKHGWKAGGLMLLYDLAIQIMPEENIWQT